MTWPFLAWFKAQFAVVNQGIATLATKVQTMSDNFSNELTSLNSTVAAVAADITTIGTDVTNAVALLNTLSADFAAGGVTQDQLAQMASTISTLAAAGTTLTAAGATLAAAVTSDTPPAPQPAKA